MHHRRLLPIQAATPMEIDNLDDLFQFNNRVNANYGNESWEFNVPKNWILILKRDRERILRKNAMNSRIRFSSIYKEAYKKK